MCNGMLQYNIADVSPFNPCINYFTSTELFIVCPVVYVQVLFGVVRMMGEEYRVGSSVFLQPGSFRFKNLAPVALIKKDKDKDKKVNTVLSAMHSRFTYSYCLLGRCAFSLFGKTMGDSVLTIKPITRIDNSMITYPFQLCSVCSLHYLRNLSFAFT
jgi:hypothetical protein